MKALVIGSGISALTLANKLHRSGHAVTVLEASERIGGSVNTIRREGFLVEAGPNTLQVNDPAIHEVLEENGLLTSALDANPSASKRYIVKKQKPCAVPASPWQGITSPLFSLKGKLRVLREPVTPKGDNPDESLADFVRRRLGQEFLDYAINPMVGGVYAGDPEMLSVRHGFPKVWNLEAEHGSLIRGAIAKMKAAKTTGKRFKTRLLSWENGMSTIIEQLAAPLSLHTSVNIQRIEKTQSGWRVRWQDTQGSHESTPEHLVLAIPAFAIEKLPLPADIGNSLESLRHIAYPPVSLLALGFPREAVRHPLDGFGMLVPEVEGINTLGTLFSSTLFPKRAPEGHILLTTFIGGSRQPNLARLPTERLRETVLQDLDKLLGIRSAPVFCEHAYWERAIPQYTCDYERYLKAIRQTEQAHPGLHIIGNFRNGISVGKCLANAYQLAENLAS